MRSARLAAAAPGLNGVGNGNIPAASSRLLQRVNLVRRNPGQGVTKRAFRRQMAGNVVKYCAKNRLAGRKRGAGVPARFEAHVDDPYSSHPAAPAIRAFLHRHHVIAAVQRLGAG